MGLSELSFNSGGGVQDLQPGLYLVYKGWANPDAPAGGAEERLLDGRPRIPALPVSRVTLAGVTAQGSLRPEEPGFQRQEPVQWLGPMEQPSLLGPGIGDTTQPLQPLGQYPFQSWISGKRGLLAKVNLTSGGGRVGKVVSPAPRPSPALMSVGAANSPAESMTHEAGNTVPPPSLPVPTAAANGAALGSSLTL